MQPNFSLENLLDLLFPWHNRRLAEQIGGEVARECRSDLGWPSFGSTGNMSIAAIRGYMRARSAAWIERKVEEVLFRRRCNPALRERVVDSAISQFVGMVVRDILLGELPIGERSMAA